MLNPFILALGIFANEATSVEWFDEPKGIVLAQTEMNPDNELVASYYASLEEIHQNGSEEERLAPESTYFPILTLEKTQELLKKASDTAYMPYPENESAVNIATDEGHIYFVDNASQDEVHYQFIDNPHLYSVDSFYQLPLSEKEERLIHELIKTIAEKSIWGLLFKKREMEKLGKKVNNVHPMRFMGYILADPKLKKCLKEVKSSSFKWDHFIDGFSDRMKEEHAKNNLMPYVPGMADLLEVSEEQIIKYIHSKDYEGLVKAML